jgi:hypothetical protein
MLWGSWVMELPDASSQLRCDSLLSQAGSAGIELYSTLRVRRPTRCCTQLGTSCAARARQQAGAQQRADGQRAAQARRARARAPLQQAAGKAGLFTGSSCPPHLQLVARQLQLREPHQAGEPGRHRGEPRAGQVQQLHLRWCSAPGARASVRRAAVGSICAARRGAPTCAGSFGTSAQQRLAALGCEAARLQERG